MPQYDLDTISQQILLAFERIGISGRGTKMKIAEVCGITPTAVGRWFRSYDKKQPSLENLLQISDITGTSLDQLIKGTRTGLLPPILTEQQVIEYSENNREKNYIIQTDVMGSSNDIAYIAPDDSMIQLGTVNYYPKNSILVFDTQKKAPNHGDLVLVKIHYKSQIFVCFRQYLNTNGKEYFSPLNAAYEKIVDFEKYEIIGYLSYQVIKNHHN